MDLEFVILSDLSQTEKDKYPVISLIYGNGTIALISHASKVMHKILQAKLQQYVNRELPDV